MQMGQNCFSCLISQVENVLGILDIEADERRHIMQKIMSLISGIDLSYPPPLVAKYVYRRINELTGKSDPFAEIKRMSNENALNLLPLIEVMFRESNNPIEDGLKISISGNIIDYGAPGSGDSEVIKKSIGDTLKSNIDHDMMNDFERDISMSDSILFIGDNSGEIVFDMEFIKQLPADKITYCVRGKPILNDSTMEDAHYIGLDKIVTLIDTGDNAPGIDISKSSKQFTNELRSAGMVILKGQGNLETVYDLDLTRYMMKGVPIYFLLKVKCDYVASLLNKKVGDIAFIRRISWETK